MDGIHNGMCAGDLGTEGWRRPWGGDDGDSVEVMRLTDGRVALRRSTDPEGPALIYTHGEISAFLRGAKAGQADFLVS